MKENGHYIPADALTMRAQNIIKERLDTMIPYTVMSSAIYEPLLALAKILVTGDTVELPDGTTLTVTWKPGQNNKGGRYGTRN